ncbi:GlsB/YeaQ/YmgE family stress response membrane protein [Enterobacter cancerogenus]|uniref:GlsB/YeaQ/YmgE family stress response membrane protein n=1 Tax=Enterobacter cancerogenus TaxID=69218 RepID=UPI0030767B34
MGVISWIIFGLIVGILARCIMPGVKHFGFILTVVLGIAGAMAGGAFSAFLGFGSVSGFNMASIGIATCGAMVVLCVVHLIRRNARA